MEHIYENDSLKRFLVDSGYIEGGQYYFYLTDHLGNNRVVANASGTAIQKNLYYPFGMAFAETSADEQKKQPYKYNGKELDQELGLNTYDYSARYFDPALPRFTTVDPLAEKYYSISPYVYVANNPIKFVDPDGKQIIIPTPGDPVPVPVVPAVGATAATSVTTIDKQAAQGRSYIEAGKAIGTYAEILAVGAITNLAVQVQQAGDVITGKSRQDKQDRKAKDAVDAAQAAVAETIRETMPDGSDDKGGSPKGGKIGAIVLGGAAIAGTIMNLTNPDASKDAAESHQDKVEEKQKQVPQDPPRNISPLERFLKWLND